ncbi:hypothetical protein BFR80_014090 [Acinetobacter pittii]|uniref:hypothetical protein n=1 Tax=Acinetobacter calcoaceticus/baumannii complex TaxID=909768 RepID=UPI000710BA29|nr:MULTISPECIES: hypothetical protein [Acinetobacter calcoaceticus/baumannii complex]KQF50332.1 hypothetical protein APC05_10715 [Acinetobacter pittii]KQF52385.1 hypothetical protein APC05_24515 [Acinetobacter pittii]MCK0925209.1 hypothetical protein [Acinetobacter pittii]
MSEPKLSQRQLVLIRRAAEDAIHACNRHYGPFVDVVAHPLNICALVDMAQTSIGQQGELNRLKNSLSDLAQKYRAEAHELGRIRDFEKSQMYSHFANELDRLNKGSA